ncbi:potassium channel family protein [Actinoplanes sp. NPDC048967]|uniref:potassium channel family protein n=1 Tax=Actinoplanes sp. NPDC048967 TaxID=3155269 RepID=UPI0033EF51D2
MRLLLVPVRRIYRGLVWLANSPPTLILSYSLLIAMCSVIYHFVEKVTYGDALWWAVVTASTVGYGDISPKTGVGRVMAGLLISLMVLIVVPLITAQFASKLIVDHDAFQHDEQEELKNNLREVRQLLAELAAREGITVEGNAAPPSAPADR